MSTTLHPTWCDPAHCDVPDEQASLGARGGAHRSKLIPLNLETEARGEQGWVYAGLSQSAKPRAGVFLKWIINGQIVGHQPINDAEPLAWLIADALANVRGDDQPVEHTKAPDQSAGRSGQDTGQLGVGTSNAWQGLENLITSPFEKSSWNRLVRPHVGHLLLPPRGLPSASKKLRRCAALTGTYSGLLMNPL